MYIHVAHVCLIPKRPEEGAGSPGSGVTNSYELPCGCWKLNLDPILVP